MRLPLDLAPLRAPLISREAWTVSAEEVGPDGLLGPAALVARAIGAAALVAAQPQVEAVSVEGLEVLAPVRAGAALVLTAALERELPGQRVVSVVIRRGEPGAQGGVAMAGVLRLALPQEAERPALPVPWLRHAARRGAAQGLTPVEARFRAAAGPETLANGRLLARLTELSLVSAQGFAGCPLAFEGVPALSVLGPARPGQPLVLRCSVVHAEGPLVTVLAHLAAEEGGEDVLHALTCFRAGTRLPGVRPTGADGVELARVLEARTGPGPRRA